MPQPLLVSAPVFPCKPFFRAIQLRAAADAAVIILMPRIVHRRCGARFGMTEIAGVG